MSCVIGGAADPRLIKSRVYTMRMLLCLRRDNVSSLGRVIKLSLKA